MAVIQYSALVTQLRGKLGGSQFNKGHAGYTLQRKSTPTIRQTPAQLKQRQNIAIIQRAWGQETTLRQQEASQAAQNNPTTDRFGQRVVLSGYNHYIKMMSWRLLVSGNQSPRDIDDPILTTTSNFAQLVVSNVEMYYNEPTADGYMNLGISLEKTPTGTPTGLMNRTRAYMYLTAVNEHGRPVRGSRPVYYLYTNFNDSPLDIPEFYIRNNLFVEPNGFVLLEVYTRNLSTGAQTGYQSEIIQLQ